MKKDTFLDYGGILISVITTVIAIFLQTRNPGTAGYLFAAFIGIIVIFWLIDYFKKKFFIVELNLKQIDKFRKDLKTLKTKLIIMNKISKLKERVSVLERFSFDKKNKKSQVDIRWILLILILVLFFLFLRAKGIL